MRRKRPKRYGAVLFWESHGHNDCDYYTDLNDDDLEGLKQQIAGKTLGGEGYKLVSIWERITGDSLKEIENDLKKMRESMLHELAMKKREEDARRVIESKKDKKEREEAREKRQYQLYLQLKEKFEGNERKGTKMDS